MKLVRLAMVVLLAAWAVTTPAQPQKAVDPHPAQAATRAAGVEVRDAEFQSPSAGRAMKYRVILPAGYSETARRYPVLYLLHGLTGDYTDWEQNTRLDEYARNYSLIIVMPDAGNSWYTNSVGNPQRKFEDYIAKDLVREIDANYRTLRLRTARFIGGLSMGGYGTLKFGLKYPGLFSFAASFSGAQSVIKTGFGDGGRWPKAAVDEFNEALGPQNGEARTANDISTLISKADPKTAPFIYLDCGTEDGLLASNRETAAQLQKAGFRFEYRERPGRHEWIYWDHQIKQVLELLAEHADIEPKSH